MKVLFAAIAASVLGVSTAEADEIPITPTFLPAAEIVRLATDEWQEVELLPGVRKIGVEFQWLPLDAVFYAPRQKRGDEKWWRIEYFFEGRKLFEVFEIESGRGAEPLIWARVFTSPREWIWFHSDCVEVRSTPDGLWLNVSQAYVKGWKEVKVK